MPAGQKGREEKCLMQVQRIMWKWEENTFKSSIGGEAECSLHPVYENAIYLGDYSGWSVTLLRQMLETTGKHVLFGQHNVLSNFELIAERQKLGDFFSS